MKNISTIPLKTIQDIPTKDKTVLVRVDYNVPMNGGRIVDARRILASLPLIETLQKKNAKIVLIAHREAPDDSLAPIAAFLKKKLSQVYFCTLDITGSAGGVENKKSGAEESVRAYIEKLPQKSVVLLENIRRYDGEKKNSAAFAKKLASLGDSYVDEAFSVAHRAHASIVGVPKLLPHAAGPAFLAEVQALSATPNHPLLFLLGGAKFETKVPLIKKFLDVADDVCITGAIANSFFKVAGFEVGKSVVDDGANKPIAAFLKSEKLLLPVDVIVERGEKGSEKKNEKKKVITCSLAEVQKNDVIVDIGPMTVEFIISKIKKAKSVIWNGPTGWYEKGYTKQTVAIAKALAAATKGSEKTKTKLHAIIGGGDTGAVIEKVFKNKNKEMAKNIFISTAGGAAIDFLAQGTLPGIDALR